MKRPKVFVIGLSGESSFFEVDYFNKIGETAMAKSMHTEPGGKGFNQAMALKKLGADVHFLTITGKDDYAEVIERELIKIGVIPHIIKVDNAKTTRAVILTNKKGENMVYVYPGVSNAISSERLIPYEEAISSCDYLLMQQEYPLEILKKGIEIAKRHQLKVIVNPAPATAPAVSLLGNIDLITPNESEAKTIFNLKDDATEEDLIEKLKEDKFKRVIVTLGSNGSLVYDSGKITKILPLEVLEKDVLDTTGAGDIYNASLLYKLGCGDDLITAAKFASVVSGLSVKKKFVLEAVPNKNEIETELNNINRQKELQ